MGDLTDPQAEQDLSPRERRQLRTSQAILDAARAIIQEEGVEALSMRALADRIDYSPASLYEYYGSKEEIVQAVCHQGHRQLRDEMARVDVALSPPAYLMEIGLVYIRFAVANPDYFRLMFNSVDVAQLEALRSALQAIDCSEVSATPAHPALAVTPQPGISPTRALLQMVMEAEDSSFPLLLMAIQRGIEDGSYRTRPGYGLLEIAYGAWSLVHGLASLRLAHGSGFPIDYTASERAILRQFGLGLEVREQTNV